MSNNTALGIVEDNENLPIDTSNQGNSDYPMFYDKKNDTLNALIEENATPKLQGKTRVVYQTGYESVINVHE